MVHKLAAENEESNSDVRDKLEKISPIVNSPQHFNKIPDEIEKMKMKINTIQATVTGYNLQSNMLHFFFQDKYLDFIVSSKEMLYQNKNNEN